MPVFRRRIRRAVATVVGVLAVALVLRLALEAVLTPWARSFGLAHGSGEIRDYTVSGAPENYRGTRFHLRRGSESDFLSACRALNTTVPGSLREG